MNEDLESPRRHFRLQADHISTFNRKVYSMTGDVVLYLGSTDGYENDLYFYQDATGERFSCAARLLVEVSIAVPLKKQSIKTKPKNNA